MKFLKTQSCPRLFVPLSLACIIAAGCSGKPAPKKPSGLPAPVVSATDATGIPMSAAGTEVMQKTVARIVGFIDIDGKTVNIYQDAYSVLYSTQQIQKGKDVVAESPPIYYYTPIFSAQIPEYSILPTRELLISIKNRETPQFVRKAIQSKAGDSLKAFQIDADNINLVPLSKVFGKLTVFGKDYAVTVASDVSSLTLKIPLSEIPTDLLTGTGAQTTVDQLKFNSKFTNSGTLSITYDYFTQQFDNMTCGLQIDSDFINKMFTDPKHECPPKPAPDFTSPTMKALSDPNSDVAKGLAKDPTYKGFDQLKAAVSSQVVGACLAAVENQKLTARSSVRCVKQGGKELSDDLKNFLTKVIVPVATVVANGYTAPYANWSKDLMAAAIALFKNPENFASTMTKMNDQFINQNDKEKRDVYLKDNSSILTTINDHATKNSDTSGSSSNGGFGINVGIGAFNAGFNSASGNSKFNNTVAEAVDALHNTNDQKRLETANNLLKEKGLDHRIENIDGTFKFYPSISISMAADVKEIKDQSSGMTTIDLGKVVSVEETTSAMLKRRPDATLVVQVGCGEAGGTPNPSQAISSTADISEAQWWQNASIFETLSADLSKKMDGLSCGQVTFGGYYTGIMDAKGNLILENSDLVPPDGVIINARAEGIAKDPKTMLVVKDAQLSKLTVLPGHIANKPLENSRLEVLTSGNRFTTIKISK